MAEGAFAGNMQMTIYASKESSGLEISQISQIPSEAEILFNVGQEMQIISAELIDGVCMLKLSWNR